MNNNNNKKNGIRLKFWQRQVFIILPVDMHRTASVRSSAITPSPLPSSSLDHYHQTITMKPSPWSHHHQTIHLLASLSPSVITTPYSSSDSRSNIPYHRVVIISYHCHYQTTTVALQCHHHLSPCCPHHPFCTISSSLSSTHYPSYHHPAFTVHLFFTIHPSSSIF